MKKPEHHLLLVWMMLTGVVVFGFVVTWHLGLIRLMVATDQSKICLVIGLFYIIGTIDCARRAVHISQQLRIAEATESLIQADLDQPLPGEKAGDSRVTHSSLSQKGANPWSP
jgi:hypothetical protein